MKAIGIAPATFQDWPGMRSWCDAYQNTFLRAPDLINLVCAQICTELGFDNLGSQQQRHFAKLREARLCRRIDDLNIVCAF